MNLLTNSLERRSTLKPIDILIFEWVERKHACMDLTWVFTLVDLRSEGFTIGQTTLKTKSYKVSKHEKMYMKNQHIFISFVFVTFWFLYTRVCRSSSVEWVMCNNVMTSWFIDLVFKKISFVIKKNKDITCCMFVFHLDVETLRLNILYKILEIIN